jgi:ABC-type Fe3+/spermidine/putrescine transport system ATPase subunit
MTLELLGLTKSYPGAATAGVRDLALRIAPGGMTALLGPSGAGKSTVLRLIAGLIAPDAGDIRLDGQSILHLPPERRGVVMVFQNALLFPHLTLAENLGFGLRMRGLPRADSARQVEAMLDRVQLSGLGDRRPHELSGGQQQRGALARALVLQPKLLLLDEPLSNLDAALRDEMRDLIRSLQRETGVTMLVVTHDQSEAVVLADRIALLLHGRLAQEDSPEAIFRRPASIAVARFFGGANFLPGRAERGVFHGPLGPLPLPVGTADGPGTLTIRPEAIGLGDPAAAHRGKVVSTTFLGTQSRVILDLADQRLEALVPPEAALGLTPGMQLGVSLPASALWLIRDGAGRAA